MFHSVTTIGIPVLQVERVKYNRASEVWAKAIKKIPKNSWANIFLAEAY